jgi:hypothetical protein
MTPSPTETGNQSEQKVQRLLAGEGIKAELGWVAHAFGLTIQLDLIDIKNKNVYEVKPGPLFHIAERTTTGLDQAIIQAALIGKSIRLENRRTGKAITKFQVRRVTWISLVVEGKTGFGPKAAERLSALGIISRRIG